MDKLSQVRGVLRAMKSIALQGVYAETYRGLESQCISSYRRCIATLKTVPGFEDVDSVAPELDDNATMKHVGFAVETVLSLISENEAPARGFPPGFLPGSQGFAGFPGSHGRRHGMGREMRKMARSMRHCGHGACHGRPGKHGGLAGGEAREQMQEDMQEEIQNEQERFEESIEKIEEQIEELQEKIEEARESLEDRLESIRDKYEERLEALEEQDEDDEDDEDENAPRD